jgi:anaerobic magnesium-protoporphyrin IX monomethyl ester cyclase
MDDTENKLEKDSIVDSPRYKSINEKIKKAKSEIVIEEINSNGVDKPNYKRRFNRILFVVTNVSASYGKALNPHLGIAMLMAYLDKHGFETDVIDEQLGYTQEEIIQKAKDFKADLIGVTMFSFDFARTYQTINKIKEATGTPLVLGGAHISSVKKECLEKTNADFGITRDGEIPLLQLCLGYPLDKIRSLIWRNDNEIIENKIRELNWKLDDLPYPVYEKFELEKYIHYIDKRLPLESSRGCPYSCTYCDVKVSMGQAFRPRSPEHIISEIKHWYDKGYRFFEFVDDVFTMDIPRAKKVCQMILESNMRFDWNCANGIRADRVDEELLILMKKSGCVFVSYGLETGNSQILKVIKKAITLERSMETFKLTKKVGLKFAVNFIVGHPEETYERGLDSIRFAKRVLKFADYVMFSNMIPYPGTDVFKWIKKQEKIGRARFLRQPEEYLKDTTTKIGLPVFETREFRYQDRIKLLKKGRAIFNRAFIQYRFGKTLGLIIYLIARDNDRYMRLRAIAMGTKIGKYTYNLIRKNYSIHKNLKGVQPGT